MTDHKEEPSEEQHSDFSRLDLEWTLVCLIREMVGIAYKGQGDVTYRQALDLGERLVPEYLAREVRNIGNNLESIVAKTFRQKAELTTAHQRRAVGPAELIDRELAELDEILQEPGRKDFVRRRQRSLSKARKEVEEKEAYSENSTILRDALSAEHSGRNLSRLTDCQYRDLKLPTGNILRIRVFHPGSLEQLTGADLVYEHHSSNFAKARLVAIQYKIWDNRTLYSSSATNLEGQLCRMKTQFCDRRLCERAPASSEQRYRLPYCMSFLRPTDKLQNPNSKLISSGYHIPICAVERLWSMTHEGNKKLESQKIRPEAVSHKSFEELFNIGILGSRWISLEELDEIYEDIGLTKGSDRILLHVEERYLSSARNRKRSS